MNKEALYRKIEAGLKAQMSSSERCTQCDRFAECLHDNVMIQLNHPVFTLWADE